MNVPGTKVELEVDKRIPIALLVTIFVQTIGLAWFGGVMFQRVNTNEANITEIRVQMKDGAGFSARLANIEQAIAEVKADIRAIRQRVQP